MSSRNDTVDELSTKYIKSLRDQCMKKGIQGIKGLGTIFRSMDNDYTRRLNLDEFKRGMRVYGLDIDDESLTRMFNKFDRDGNSVVDFEEFLAQLRPPMAQCRVDVVNQAFDKLDVTKDGLLMVDDLTGRTIGRVPANLCRLFSELLEDGMTEKIVCVYKGEIRTAGATRFARGGRGCRDRAGGGPELKCQYRMTLRNDVTYQQIDAKIKRLIPREDRDNFSL